MYNYMKRRSNMKRRIAAIIVVIALALTSLGIITVHADLHRAHGIYGQSRRLAGYGDRS